MICWEFPDAQVSGSWIRFHRDSHAQDFLGFCDSHWWGHRLHRVFPLDDRQDQVAQGFTIRPLLQHL